MKGILNGIIINGMMYELQNISDQDGYACEHCHLRSECGKISGKGVGMLCEVLHGSDIDHAYKYVGDVDA